MPSEKAEQKAKIKAYKERLALKQKVRILFWFEVILKVLFQKSKEQAQKQITDDVYAFFVKHNLHCVITDMLNKLYLEKPRNAYLFMAEYLLNMNHTTVEQYLETKAESLSTSDSESSSSSSPMDSD